MPKLGSAVAAASMSQYPPTGFHTYEIKEVEYKVSEETGSEGYQFKFAVIASDEDPSAVKRTFFKYINVIKGDGKLNEMGAGEIRKIVAAAVSAEASADPDYEVDDLVGKTFAAKLSVKEKDGQEEVRLSRHTAA